MRFKTIVQVIPAALLLAASCSPALYLPKAEDAHADASLDDLKRGRELYTQRCGSCHTLVLPDRFTPEQWKVNVDRMQSRAAISDSEKTLILSYILAGHQRAQTE